ncbi:N-methyl-L-tryptophan oxidase [Natronobiforma cellulositropha]|uniref:N-methyl-L-tryptophan oxidase n=1 Tax=Natronobiforma cellulositropha TaxID=1679076 RepID=UPI0021D5B321|nr:N-methyl-L-tryptophan oxidase [Natronobiforma cellulositropha]
MNSRRYDVIVVGVGGVGSATVASLATRGADVLGLERFDVPNDYGESHGYARAIRPATDEVDAAVDLLGDAHDHWQALETDHGRPLLLETGALDVAPEGSRVLERTRRACERLEVEYEDLSHADLAERYPVFDLPGDEYAALSQPAGGLVAPQQCTIAHVERAHEAGATIHARERATGWRSSDDGVRVDTNHDTYRADRLVLTAGTWTPDFVDDLADHLVCERRLDAWFHPHTPEAFTPEQLPVFSLTVGAERYDGAPTFAVPGFKVGRHRHRRERVDPDEIDREPMPEDERILRSFTEHHLPEGAGETMRLEPSVAATTPDGTPVVDTLAAGRVAVAVGFSGRRFAYAPVAAEILTDLVLEGETDYEIDAFSLERFDE